ncbi:MAG: c-type cytochrome [Ignavibacteria bacterium]|nr:c-type cytochrome [Ignavibacteria bacterium]
MEFLDKMVLQQSAHHMVLLKYLLVLTLIIFYCYAGLLLGSTFLSLFYKLKSKKLEDSNNSIFSKMLIDLVTFNKSVGFALGIIPIISASFCYAQLLHKTGLDLPEFILIAALIFYFGLGFVYLYKFRMKKNKSSWYFGIISTVLLAVSTLVLIGSTQLAIDSENWKNQNDIISIVLSARTIFSYLHFVVFSLLSASLFFLYKYFRNNSEEEFPSELLRVYSRNQSLKIGLVSVIILPALVLIYIFLKPISSLSFNFFGYAVLALISLLVISVFLYVMIKENKTAYGSKALFFLVLFISIMVIKDQFAFDTATKKHFVVLASEYEEYQKKVQEEFGLLVETINGADIFNGKCVACHQFDKKLVGPPYNETLPKYEGKKEALVQFILNPVKINPDYPPMASQGLKPSEAEAVADYILSTYKK